MKKMEKPNRIFNFRLVVFVALSLIFGITSAYFFVLEKVLVGILCICVFAFSIILYFIPYKKSNPIKIKVVFAFIFVVFFLIGNLSFNFVVKDYNDADLFGHYYTVSGRVAEVRETDGGVRLLIKDAKIQGNRTGGLKYGIYAYVYGASSIEVGDFVSFYTALSDKGLIYEGKFAASDLLRGVKYMAELYSDDVTVSGNSVTVFDKVNAFIKNTLSAGLDKDEFSTAYAMLTGHDEFIDYELINSYRNAGVAHVFAVSGLHVGFLAMALNFLLDKFKTNKLLKAFLITGVLFFYSGVCGFSSSSIRATIMTAVTLFLTVRGVRYDGLTSLSLSAIIILIMQPANLFYVGFQLSFIVVLGIIILAQPLSKIFRFLPKKLANSLGSVLAAQIASIPVCLLAFNKFSTIAVITNLIFIPVVSVVFVTLLTCTLIGGIFSIAHVALFVPNYALKVINICIGFFDLSIFMVGGIVLGGFVLLYALIVLIASDVTNLKKKTKAIVCLVLAVIFTVGTAVVTTNFNSASYLYVLGSEKICATVIKTPQESVMVVSYASKIYSAGRLKRLSEQENFEKIDTVILLDGFNVDKQVFLTKLRAAFEVNNLCYYGEKDQVAEDIIKKSFKDINVYALTDSSPIKTENIKCSYELDGAALNVIVGGKKIAIFSWLKSGGSYAGLNGNYDLTVSVDTPESVKEYYNAAVGVGYLANSSDKDGQSEGTFKYQIK